LEAQLTLNKFVNMSTVAQARYIARQQKLAEQHQQILAALLSDETPMEAIMDKRLPLSDQERQNLWNQRAANVWSARQQGLRGSSVATTEDPYAGLVSQFGRSDGPVTGTPNQIGQGLRQLAQSPEWLKMDDKARIGTLQRIYGNEVAQKYSSQVLDTRAIDYQRRKAFDDDYTLERTMERERLQSQARLGSTEPEMLHRNLMNRDWVVRPEGIMERNPDYNPNNPLSANIQPYVPASPMAEATVARYWDQVMPGRANPLHPEKLMRIKVAEKNPGASPEEIARLAQIELANTLVSQQRNIPIEDVEARRRLQGYTNGIPVTKLLNAPQQPSGNTPSLRLGEKINQVVTGFGHNMARDASRFLPAVQSRLTNLAEAPLQAATSATQFIEDLLGTGRQVPVLPAAVPIPPTETSVYGAYPDWLKGIYNSPLR
jgi:hypothetical protein